MWCHLSFPSPYKLGIVLGTVRSVLSQMGSCTSVLGPGQSCVTGLSGGWQTLNSCSRIRGLGVCLPPAVPLW